MSRPAPLGPLTIVRPQNDGSLSVQIDHDHQVVCLVSDFGLFHEDYSADALDALILALQVARRFLR